MKPRLVVTGPLPPPSHGVSISTELILRNPRLAAEFEVEHFDTSDRRSVANVGRWDIRNVLAALSALARLVFRLRGKRGVFYLPISQGIPGLAPMLRDLPPGCAFHPRCPKAAEICRAERPQLRDLGDHHVACHLA